MEWFVLALLPRSRNRLVELNSRCGFVDWLLERWQSVNDCNEQKSVIRKGMNDAEVFVKKSTSLVTILSDDDSHSEINWHRLMTVVVYYPTPSDGWGRGGTPRRPNSRATPQGLDQRSRIERERSQR